MKHIRRLGSDKSISKSRESLLDNELSFDSEHKKNNKNNSKKVKYITCKSTRIVANWEILANKISSYKSIKNLEKEEFHLSLDRTKMCFLVLSANIIVQKNNDKIINRSLIDAMPSINKSICWGINDKIDNEAQLPNIILEIKLFPFEPIEDDDVDMTIVIELKNISKFD